MTTDVDAMRTYLLMCANHFFFIEIIYINFKNI